MTLEIVKTLDKVNSDLERMRKEKKSQRKRMNHLIERTIESTKKTQEDIKRVIAQVVWKDFKVIEDYDTPYLEIDADQVCFYIVDELEEKGVICPEWFVGHLMKEINTVLESVWFEDFEKEQLTEYFKSKYEQEHPYASRGLSRSMF